VGATLTAGWPDRSFLHHCAPTLPTHSFQGPLPSSWSKLTGLETVELSLNHLTGSLPPTYSSWAAIQSIDLHGNRLSGPLPATWAAMSLLEVRVWRSMLRRMRQVLASRSFLTPHTVPQVLDLSSNALTSTLPAAWAQLLHLSVLSLNGNALKGALPPAWAGQRSLLQL
jgi:hypothetical protein